MAAYSTSFLDRVSPPHIATLVIVTGLGAMVMNMFLPSLKPMAEFYDVDYRLMQVAVPGYLAASAVFQLLVGPIADRFGRRPVLLAGVFVFLVATLGCIYATNVYWFLFFRAVQATAAIGMSLSRAIVRDLLPMDKAASMIGYVTMGMAIVPMFSPAIGGVLDEHFGWQATFWFMFASGVLVLAMIYFDLGETNPSADTSFRDQVREYPELLRSVRFWGYCAAAAFGSGVFFAYLGGASYIGNEVYGLSTAWLGLVISAPAYGYMLGNFLSGRYSQRLGVNRMIAIGASTTTFGIMFSFFIALIGMDNFVTFFGFMAFVGVGNGMVIPASSAGMVSVRPKLAGTASGLGTAMMIGGGAGLSAFAGMMMSPGHPAQALLAIMLLASCSSLVAIWAVVRRERSLGLE